MFTNLLHFSGTSDLFTVFLIVNAALGAGLLNFPKAFDEAGGITVAILVQLALLLFIVIALNMLAYSSDRNPSSPANTIEGKFYDTYFRGLVRVLSGGVR